MVKRNIVSIFKCNKKYLRLECFQNYTSTPNSIRNFRKKNHRSQFRQGIFLKPSDSRSSRRASSTRRRPRPSKVWGRNCETYGILSSKAETSYGNMHQKNRRRQWKITIFSMRYIFNWLFLLNSILIKRWPSLKLTASLPLKIDGWFRWSFLLGPCLSPGALADSFREGKIELGSNPQNSSQHQDYYISTHFS